MNNLLLFAMNKLELVGKRKQDIGKLTLVSLPLCFDCSQE